MTDAKTNDISFRMFMFLLCLASFAGFEGQSARANRHTWSPEAEAGKEGGGRGLGGGGGGGIPIQVHLT